MKKGNTLSSYKTFNTAVDFVEQNILSGIGKR